MTVDGEPMLSGHPAGRRPGSQPIRRLPERADVTARSDLGSSIWGRWQTWAAMYATTLTVGFLIRLHRYLAAVVDGQPFSFWLYFALGLPQYLVLSPLRIIGVWLIADHFRFDRERWRRSALVHAVTSLLVTHAYLLAQVLVVTFITPASAALAAVAEGRSEQPLSGVVRTYTEVLRTGVQPQFLWYWAVVGVYYAYRHYLESREQRVRAAELQASLMETRFERLKSQLSPHFLFNTLNTISVLALRGEREAAAEALELLGNLLRTTLDDTRPDRIPLQQEMAFVEQYLEIQRMRFAGRLTTRCKVAAEVANAMVPAMILQPIVENAVKHGVLERESAGLVSIQAARDNGMLRLQVTDSGPGFGVDSPDSVRRGIGLSNTEARLEHVYGSACRIEYGSSDGGGSVTISIPFSEVTGPAPDAARVPGI
jgi:two-component system, LytTR family, sensor kinase